MQQLCSRCTQFVDLQKTCIHCNGNCVKNGLCQGKQRYLCKACKRSFVGVYTYKAYYCSNEAIANHVKHGLGIRAAAQLLQISTGTVLRRIIRIAKAIPRPAVMLCKEYELDELCTYVRKKTQQLWVVYAIRRDTKEVVDFTVGRRTNKTLKRVTDTLLLSCAKKIFTDKLCNYQSLIPTVMHSTLQYGTNHIERKNLDVRTQLKRFNRRTICFSKSIHVMMACLKIYFWG